MQVARAAAAIRQLAHDLHPHESLGQKRRAGEGLRGIAAPADRARQDRIRFARQHAREGASRWNRGVKENGAQSIGKSRGGWTTKIHLVAANARTALALSLSPGQAADGPEGRKPLRAGGEKGTGEVRHVITDRAYEGDETRQLVLDLEMGPVVPPKSNRLEPGGAD